MKIRMFWMAWVLSSVVMAGCGGGDNSGTGGSSGGSGGGGGDGGTTAMGGSCPTQASGSAANHIVITVSWPDSLGLKAGEGEMHVWTKADLTFDGNDVTGTVKPCGSMIPALTKSDLAGGGMVQTVIPDEVWEAASMPVFDVKGSISGFDVGATIGMEPVASVVGATLADPANDPWPASAAQLTTVDADGDGQPGIKAVPRTDGDFQAPPLDLNGALDPMGDRADELYLASRTMVKLAGTRDSCTSAKGTADVTHVDSHVVGCHVKGKDYCTAEQSKFVDDNQPKFTIKSATYEMVQVPAGATCADVRAALPAE